MEDIASFRLRAREWLAAHMPPAEESEAGWGLFSDEEELQRVNRDRELQRRLFDGGLAGICFPLEYGGQGLTPAHQRVFDEEVAEYQIPVYFQVPTLGVCAATLLDFGSEEQKRRHIPAILRGEELWMQFLSEPTAGSDVASCLTTATPDGDEWVLDGSKVWTTGAWWADYALCLARTDWDVPKHQGLTVFIVKIHQPGIDIHRIEMINGSREFCQEYISGVRLSDSARVGPVGQGWSVTTGWLYRERESVGDGSPYVTQTRQGPRRDRCETLVELANETGQLDDPRVRDLLGEAWTLDRVQQALGPRMMDGIAAEKLHNSATALLRLFNGTAWARLSTIGFEIAGTRATAWREAESELGQHGMDYLMRQSACIAGGTTEMARNVIADRLLGMPREITPDRDRPFRDVPKNAAPTSK